MKIILLCLILSGCITSQSKQDRREQRQENSSNKQMPEQ